MQSVRGHLLCDSVSTTEQPAGNLSPKKHKPDCSLCAALSAASIVVFSAVFMLRVVLRVLLRRVALSAI